jgi:hypothetical protein
MNKSTFHNAIKVAALLVVSLISLTMTGKKLVNSTKPDFDFPKTVIENADKNLHKALQDGNSNDVIKYLIQSSLAKSMISDDNMPSVIKGIDSVAAIDKNPCSRAILYHLEAMAYNSYYSKFSYKISGRIVPDGTVPDDITEWSPTLFHKKIISLVNKSITDVAALQHQPITAYPGVITCDSLSVPFYPTLFDFLTYHNIDLLTDMLGEARDNATSATKEEVNKIIEGYYSSLRSQHAEDAAPAITAEQKYADWKHDAKEKLEETALNLFHHFSSSEYSSKALIWYLNQIDSIPLEYQMLKAQRDKFPKSAFTAEVINRIINIESKNVKTSNAGQFTSRDSVKVNCEVHNVNDFTIYLYKLPAHLRKYDAYDKLLFSKLTLVTTKNIHVDGTVPFNGKVDVEFPPLDYGRYFFFADFPTTPQKSRDIELRENVPNVFSVSDIMLFSSMNADQPAKAFAVDAHTGAPLQGVGITRIDNFGLPIPPTQKSDFTNSLGYIEINSEKWDRFSAVKGSDRYAPIISAYEHSIRREDTKTSAKIFTDLGVYRPGETIKYTVIIYDHGDDVNRTINNAKFKASFFDSNNQLIKKNYLSTDDYGRCSGSFDIPADRLNGNFSIKVTPIDSTWDIASASVTVSEYKTPTFYIDFPDKKSNFATDCDVNFKGKVTTYSQVPVADTKVECSLSRNEWCWWGSRNNNADESLSTFTVTTDAEGNFNISIPKEVFEKCGSNDDEPWSFFFRHFFHYKLTASATNAAGETQSAEKVFWLGNRRHIECGNLTFNLDKPVALPVKVTSTEAADTSSTCNYSITDSNKEIVKTGSFPSKNPAIDLSSLASGQYDMHIEIKDDSTANKIDQPLVVYHLTDKVPPVKSAMWLPENEMQVHGKAVSIILGNSSKESNIYYIVSTNDKIVKEGWQHFSTGLHTLKFEAPSDTDRTLTVDLVCTSDFRTSQWSHRFTLQEDEKLTIKATSFRDHITPNTPERWSFQLLNNRDQLRQGAFICEMYNKALDAIVANNWSPLNIYEWLYDLTSVQTASVYPSSSSFSWTGNFREVHRIILPELNMYNKNFFSRSYSNMFMRFSQRMMCASLGESDTDEEDTYIGNPMEIADLQKAETKEISRSENDAAGEDSAPKGKENLSNIPIRKGEIKTALWMPSLVADKDGNVTVEFSAPNFSTTWLFQAIAYTDNLLSARFVSDVVAQKPVMVQPSLPRFLRHGDKATLSASVLNSSDEVQNCDVLIELFDPATNKVISTKQVKVSLQPHATQAVFIPWDVPDSATFVGYRIKAATANFGDGEQDLLSVLPSVSPVIETTPLFINAGTKHYSLDLPKFRSKSRITLEYCDNPVWYCVTALPSIHSDNYITATALAHSLFAIALAQGIAKSDPQIKEAITYWENNEQDSVLVSMLEKNQDLKVGTLLASPWMQEAQRQTLQMKSISRLFDSIAVKAEMTKIVDELKSHQRSNGGFAWLNHTGCHSDEYTTHAVLELLGELKHLGYLPANPYLSSMIDKAVKYCDSVFLRNYNSRKDKNDYSGFASYAYVRTLFPSISQSNTVKELFHRVLNYMTKEWKGQDLADKAYFALTLNRNGYTTDASTIVESLRQFSITKPSTGMYWDNLRRGWYYFFNKVSITSLMLQTFAEVVPSDTADIDQIRKWILLQKQVNDWGGSSMASDAIYAILSTGTKWIGQKQEMPAISINSQPVRFSTIDRYLGYCKKQLTIDAAANNALTIDRDGYSPAWGAVYCQYSAPMESLKAKSIPELSLEKEIYTYAKGSNVPSIAKNAVLHVGDKVQVRFVIKNTRDLEFVTLTDERGACFEPLNQISEYKSLDGTGYYLETKDSKTNLFFDYLPKGTHILNFDLYVTAEGSYSVGIATIQCQYAPQVTAHSSGESVIVK